MSAGIGAVGFASLLVCIAPAAPPPILMLVLLGAMTHGYSLVVKRPQAIQGHAMRHVEEIVALTPLAGETTSDTVGVEVGHAEKSCVNQAALPDTELEEATAAAKPDVDLKEAPTTPGTVEGRLEVDSELHLEIKSANLNRYLRLARATDPWKGARYTGLVSDDRVPFGDLCQKFKLLHVDLTLGICDDMPAVLALLQTKKVVAEERADARIDIERGLQLPSGSATKLPGTLLSEVRPTEAEQFDFRAGLGTPAEEARKVGVGALGSGLAVGAMTLVFVAKVGRAGDDAETVERWRNFRLRDYVLS